MLKLIQTELESPVPDKSLSLLSIKDSTTEIYGKERTCKAYFQREELHN